MAKKKPAKAPALAAPQTDEEANALLAEYGACFNTVARAQASLDASLQAIKAAHEEAIKPYQLRMTDIFEALHVWATAHRNRLTQDGKTKTVALPAGTVSWRQAPPKVSFARGLKADDVIARIRDLAANAKLAATKRALLGFIRASYAVNKEAMLDNRELASLIEGVKIASDGEQFAVEPFGAELAEPAS